jgi:hypothetical protein
MRFDSYDFLNIRNPFLCIMMLINPITEVVQKVSRDSEVSIATRYDPVGPCIE